MRRTQVVYELAQTLVALLAPRIGPTITGDSFILIENDRDLRLRYDYAVSLLGEHVVNSRLAQYISQITGRVASGRRLKTSSRLVKSGRYSELVPDGTRDPSSEQEE
ncbi:MAG: hypothetical protein HGA45_33975 [Chloroflexales bacterium]|nr:hypothetical protein [Chloroflexales bacterium]